MPNASRWKCGDDEHDAARHDPVGEALPGAVDVGEERLEGADALLHAEHDVVPLPRRDDPRQEVEGERAAPRRRGRR